MRTAQRLPREALAAITNSYFGAITSHDGSVALTRPGCGRVENGSPMPRNVFSEWFVIDAGMIRRIYTAMFYPPPELAVPNWRPYEGHWPLPARPQVYSRSCAAARH